MLRDKKFLPPQPSPTIGLNGMCARFFPPCTPFLLCYCQSFTLFLFLSAFTVFEFSGARRTLFRLWDLGGEEGLRKLWLDYYPQCHAVVFVSRPSLNDMIDSLQCFQSVATCELLENVPMLLFINRLHECEEKEEVGDPSPLLEFAARAPKNLRRLHVMSGDANDELRISSIVSKQTPFYFWICFSFVHVNRTNILVTLCFVGNDFFWGFVCPFQLHM
jgi:hypothetical protein